ncbi:MAG: hypothetical protein JW929_06205 [Anaerolineales bacterium]|nr:hypothetical protein [Anaerolineales bacterium]
MRTATTRTQKYSANPSPTWYLAFELGWNTWTLGFSVGLGQPPRIRRVDARDLGALEEEISMAKKRFGLPPDAPVRSCYEAGRDGFPGISGQDGLAASILAIPGNRQPNRRFLQY